MRKIKAVFFSNVPAVIQAVNNFFYNEQSIKIQTLPLNQLAYFNIRNCDHEIIIIDNGVLSPTEINIINQFFSARDNNKKYILLTAKLDAEYLSLFISGGVEGIISKKSELEILRECILKVKDGERYLDHFVKEAFHNNRGLKNIAIMQRASADPPCLSLKEKLMIECIGKGMNNMEIAEKLFISPKTVEVYKIRIANKLNLNSSRQLTIYAALQLLKLTLVLFAVVPWDSIFSLPDFF